MTIGISIKPTIGIGDSLQFSSVFENYFKAKGEMLIDVDKPWFLDYNPYVIRDPKIKPEKIIQMWNFSPTQYEWPIPKGREDRALVYLSNAEIWASLLGVPAVLNRIRLYRFEDYEFEDRKMILLHTNGVSHGNMPRHIVEHVIKKYRNHGNIYRIGNPPSDEFTASIPQIKTETLWDLASVISKAKMLIGMDSSPSWIAAAYPDVIVKKIRTKPNPPELFEDWVPLQIRNIHSHWDDRCHQIYNVSEKDIGFTWSYKRI